MDKWCFYHCDDVEEFKKLKLGQFSPGDQIVLGFKAINGLIYELGRNGKDHMGSADKNGERS